MIDPEDVITSAIYPQALHVSLLHRRVTMVGFHKEHSIACPCCKRQIRKTLPVNFNLKDIGFLGSGYSLYFMFNRMCLLLCICLLFAFKITPVAHEAIKHHFGHKVTVKEYQVMSVLVVMMSLMVFLVFEKLMSELTLIMDEEQVDPEDYSVWVRNIPIEVFRQKRIQKQIRHYFQTAYGTSIKIASLCFCYNLVPLGRFLSRKKDQLKRLKLYQTEKQKKERLSNVLFKSQQLPFEGVSEYHGVKTSDDSNIEMGNFEQYTKQKIAAINELINFSYNESDLMFIGQCIISFQTVEMRDIILRSANHSYFYGNKLEIQKATNPRDIFWHNLHLDTDDLKLRNAFSWVSCIALIFMMLSIKIFAAWVVVMLEDTKYESSVLKSSTSSIIILMNIIIQDVFLKELSHFQGHRTRVKSLTTFTLKCITLQILTSLVVPYLSAYFIFQMKEEETYLEKMDEIINRGAMVSLFLISISHRTILSWIKIKMYELGGWRFIPKKILTMKQLATLYQLPQFQIQKRYSETIKNTILAFCFGAILPKSIVYVIVHLVFVYWIDKYNFVRRRSVMIVLNNKMNSALLKVLYLILPVYLISTMIYTKKTGIIMTSLLVISFLAIKLLSRRGVRQKRRQKAKQMSFWEGNLKYFHTDYRRQNPALEGVSQLQFQVKVKQMNPEMNLTKTVVQSN